VRVGEHAPTAIPGFDRNYRDYQVGFDAYWELDFWGKYRRGAGAAQAEYLATVADYQGALVALSAEVARTYVDIRMYELLIDQAKTNVAIQEEALQIAQSRFKNGATSELDVQQATNLLETTRSTIPNLQRELQQAQNALSTLLGRPTGFVQTMLSADAGLPALPAKVGVSVPAEVLRRRADIRAAEMRAMAQSERIGVAKADMLPRFTLFGFIGTESSSRGGTLFGPGSFIYNAGGSLLWPILNYTRIKNNIRVEEARFRETIANYVETVLRATQEVEDGIAGYLRDQDSSVFAQNAVTAAEAAVKISLIQYREGAVDYQRVLDAQRALLDSQDLLTRTRSSAVTSLIALYKALGGGWEMRPPQFPGR
jgi:NodT family efflux transporter outer membrane factor (OMF) lipoprotein